MKEPKHIQEPQDHTNDDDSIQDRFDAPCHGDEPIHQPQQNADRDEDFQELNQGHDLFVSFFPTQTPGPTS